MSGNVWNPDQRNYPDTITPNKKKTDYSSLRGWHPDNKVNQEYIDAGAASDRTRSLCFAIHDGKPCRRPVTWREGSMYCNKGRGDA